MKVWKWVVGVLIGVVALILLAVVTLTLLIDPNRFRGQIEAAVQETTGRPFKIRGDLEIAWFPWLAVRTGAAELGNPAGIEGPPLARWKSARVGVRLVPLIQGQLKIDRIRFEGLEAHLKRTADGRANWDGLLAKREGADKRKPSTLELAGVEVREGVLDYMDEKSGVHYRVDDWKLDVGAWTSDALAGSLPHTQPRERDPHATQGGGADATQGGTVQATGSDDPHAIRGTVAPIRTSGRATGSSLPVKGVPFEANVPSLAVTSTPLSLSAPRWELQLAQAELAGSLSLEIRGKQIRADGPLSIEIPSTRTFLTDLGIDAPVPRDTQAMGRLMLKTTWAFVEGAITLKPIELQLDDTSFKGEIVRSSGEQPTWSFDLRGDRIDLARYVLIEDKSDEPFELPVEALRALRAQGTLAFDQAQFANTLMKNARLRVLMTDGKVQTTSGRTP